MNQDRPVSRSSLGTFALCLFAVSCDIGMGKIDPTGIDPIIDEEVGPHEIEVAGSEPTSVAIFLELDSSRPITASLGLAIEGVVIDRGPADDIWIELDCPELFDTDTGSLLEGQTIRVETYNAAFPSDVHCALTFEPREPLAAPVFIQWLTSVDVPYADRSAGLDARIDVMAPEPSNPPD